MSPQQQPGRGPPSPPHGAPGLHAGALHPLQQEEEAPTAAPGEIQGGQKQDAAWRDHCLLSGQVPVSFTRHFPAGWALLNPPVPSPLPARCCASSSSSAAGAAEDPGGSCTWKCLWYVAGCEAPVASLLPREGDSSWVFLLSQCWAQPQLRVLSEPAVPARCKLGPCCPTGGFRDLIEGDRGDSKSQVRVRTSSE